MTASSGAEWRAESDNPSVERLWLYGQPTSNVRGPGEPGAPLTSQPLDLWAEVVGIPVDLWAAARTSGDVAELVKRRERGEFLPKPFRPCVNCLVPVSVNKGEQFPVCDGACSPGRYRGPYLCADVV